MRGHFGSSLAAGVLVATLGVVGAPSAAAADPVVHDLQYDCQFFVNGVFSEEVKVTLAAPTSAVASQPIQLTDFTLALGFEPHDYDGISPVGATQADGTVDTALVLAPGDDGGAQGLPLSLTIPPTPIPDPSGPTMWLNASGTVPPFTPSTNGQVVVSAPASFTINLTPRDAEGNETILGTLVSPTCTATSDTTLAVINVS